MYPFNMIEERFIHRVEGPTKKEPTYKNFRAGDVPQSQADTSNAQQLLGYQPRHKITEEIDDATDWFVEALT